jgi:hypothetical protein
LLVESGLFVEIEETIDNKTRVYQIKKLPPIYSQTMKRSTDSKNDGYPDSNIEQVFGDKNGKENEVPLSEEDAAIQKDFEGDCVASHWRHCNSLKHIIVMDVYNKTDGRSYIPQHMVNF